MRFDEIQNRLRDEFEGVSEGATYSMFELYGQDLRVVHRSEDWIAIAAVICDAELIDPISALEYNRYKAQVGAMAIERGRYQLRQLLPLRGLHFPQVADVARALAAEAARVLALVKPIRSIGPIFDSYSE